jgi:hypothetical protein
LNPNGIVKFECDRCSNLLTYSGADIEMEAISSDERSMGPEVYYRGDCTYICPVCENEIYVAHEAWEYPVGAFNYGETKVMGAVLVEGFKDLDFAFEEEIYSFDEQSKIYLPEPKKIITSLESGISDLINAILRRPESIYNIDDRKFEEIIAHVFNKAGFEVELTKKTRDGGRDIIALKYDLDIPIKFIIECKRWAKVRCPVNNGHSHLKQQPVEC